jgi:hypothetical protein
MIDYEKMARELYNSQDLDIDMIAQALERAGVSGRIEVLEKYSMKADDAAEQHLEPGWSHFTHFMQELDDEVAALRKRLEGLS